MNLFDHVRNLYQSKIPFDSFSREEAKTYVPFMINRFISMNVGVLWAVNAVQQYPIPPREHQMLWCDLLPHRKRWDKYIKANTEADNAIPEVPYLMKFYKISKKQALDYYTVLSASDEGMEELHHIISMYGGPIHE